MEGAFLMAELAETCVLSSARPSTRASIRRRLLGILAVNLAPEILPPNADDATGLLGSGIGLDSIEVLALVCALEEAFEITIADECLKRAYFETVGSVVTFVQERLPR